MSPARTLQRLHIAVIAAFVFGGFGGWAGALLSGGFSMIGSMWLSWLATSVLLAVLGHRVERACGRAERGWPALAFWSCIPVVRIFTEIQMVTRMADATGVFVEDASLGTRARRLMLARAFLGVLQYLVPLLMWSIASAAAIHIVPAFIAAFTLITIVLIAVATHLVVAPVTDKLARAVPVALAGAGANEPVAVSTVR